LNLNQANTSSSINEEIMNNNSSTSEESSKPIILEENIRIQKTITSWAQGKVTKDEWETLREPFNNIIIRTSLDAGKLTCVIACFCGANYNVSQFSKRGSKSKRWIYSNFQMHLLKKHIQNTNSSATKFVNEKSRITHDVSKTPEFSNTKIGHNIEFANTGNIEKASQNVNNEEDTVEVMNVVEVIDQAEITFDTVNVIDIVEDIVEENRIIDSQKINEEYDNDCSISNSSYVVDPNIDSSTHTYPTSKVNASQCDKWKSMKYQRSERLKRVREKLSPNQNLITDYFILAEKISKIICHNSEVTENLVVEDVDICASSSILLDESDFKLESLELKDFSKRISRKSITENSPFVEIKVNDKIMIVKKSYCWLLDQCKGKISTDRLRRFITLNNTNKRKNCTKVQLEKKQKYLKISNSFKEDQMCNEECFLENDPNTKVPEILLEKYYAVFYDDSYYIGRVVEQCKNQVKMKFLKSELDCFI